MQLEHTSLQHKMKALVIEPFTIEDVATEEIGRGQQQTYTTPWQLWKQINR